MEHVVFYQSAQGAPAFRRLASLEDAVSFAEHLRNVEGVTDFSVFSLSPVTLSLRAYYHVEVAAGDGAPAQLTASESAPPLPTDAPAMDAAPTPSMSFNALEEEASAPGGQMPPPPPADAVPFAAAPLPPAGGAGPIETFVKDAPSDFGAPAAEDSVEPAAVDPNVVDPTVEEVVPAATSGRRSMGFFARS
jgi:hypothetical protein